MNEDVWKKNIDELIQGEFLIHCDKDNCEQRGRQHRCYDSLGFFKFCEKYTEKIELKLLEIDN